MRIVAGTAQVRALVGEELGTSDWFVIDQARINSFAEAIEDRQWIHVDPARAKAELPIGTTIVHGFLSLALISFLVRQTVRIDGVSRTLNYGLNRVRFPAPIPAGSRVRVRCKVGGVEDIEGGIQILWAITMEAEGVSKPVLVADWLVRYFSVPQTPTQL